MIQIGAKDSYVRANVKTPHGTSTVADSFTSGGTPTLTLMTPTLADGPQMSLGVVTPTAVWSATQKSLSDHRVGVDQVQLISVMIIAGKPTVSIIFRDGSREDVRIN
jgi:hypothetical protein